MGIAYAVNAIMCGDKKGQFKNYLDELSGEQKNDNKTLDDMKKIGLPVEEH